MVKGWSEFVDTNMWSGKVTEKQPLSSNFGWMKITYTLENECFSACWSCVF